MQLNIVIHEVHRAETFRHNWKQFGPLLTSLGDLGIIQDAPSRIFSLSNYMVTRKSKIWTFKESANSDSPGSNEFLVELPNRKLLLCSLQQLENFSSSHLDGIRRPGKRSTREMIENKGLKAMTNDRVYSIAVSTQSETLIEEGALDGWLVVSAHGSHPVQWFGTYLFVALGVAIERALLNGAIQPAPWWSFPWLVAPLKLQALKSWPTLPTIDSTKVARAYLQLRQSLH